MEKGQLLIELVVALGIFIVGISVFAFLIFDSYLAGRLSLEITQANFLTEEGLEAARSIRDNKGENLVNGNHGLRICGGNWHFFGTSETIDGKFTRIIQVEELDLNRKKITSRTNWQFTADRPQEVKLVTHLTNWAKTTSNWTLPSFVGSFNTPGASDGNDLFLSGNILYLVTTNNPGADPEFYSIDVSTPTAPTLLGSLNLGATATAVTVSGNFAYVSSFHNDQELQIVDISNPSSPFVAASFNTPGTSNGNDIILLCNTLYLVTTVNPGAAPEFYSIDVSNPVSPSLLGSLNLGATATAVTVSGNFAYVSSFHNDQELQIVDISNPSAPSLAGFFNAAGGTNASAIASNFPTIYLGRFNDAGGELLILDASNPVSVFLLGSYEVGNNLNDIYFNSHRTFLATSHPSQEFQLVNVEDPASPIPISQLDLVGSANGIFYSARNDLSYLATTANTQELVITGPGP